MLYLSTTSCFHNQAHPVFTGSPLECLALAAVDRRRKAYKPNTIRNYVSAQRLFLQFCLVYKIDVTYPSELDLAAYTEFLSQSAMSAPTIKNHASAIKALYQWWGKKDIVQSLSTQAWRLTVKGLINTIRPSYDKRAAMNPDDLWTIIETCHWQGSEFTPLVVALTFGFFGFLRISNLAPPTARDFDPAKHTTIGDVLLQNQGLILNLKWTKTRQACRNAISIPLPALGESILCPLKAWLAYMKLLRDLVLPMDAPLLVTEDAKPITIPILRRLFHKACEAAGYEGAGYTPHSLRRGGATFAYHAGVTLEAIKHHGTWRSQAVETYLFAQPLFDTPVATSFQKLLNNFQ